MKSLACTWGQFHRKCARYLWYQFENYLFDITATHTGANDLISKTVHEIRAMNWSKQYEGNLIDSLLPSNAIWHPRSWSSFVQGKVLLFMHLMQWNFYSDFFFEGNTLQNVICNMAAILFRPQCVNFIFSEIPADGLALLGANIYRHSDG